MNKNELSIISEIKELCEQYPAGYYEPDEFDEFDESPEDSGLHIISCIRNRCLTYIHSEDNRSIVAALRRISSWLKDELDENLYIDDVYGLLDSIIEEIDIKIEDRCDGCWVINKNGVLEEVI